MAELEIKYPKRVRFPSGEQKRFIELAKSKLNLTTEKVAKLVGIHPRSFRDWQREKLNMSLPALELLCLKAEIPVPKNTETIGPFWYTTKGAAAGWITIKNRYGKIPVKEEYRKKKWTEWWEIKGKYNPNGYFVSKSIDIPKKSLELAEFTGIMLGDGGITNKQATVSLNCFTDKEYANFVTQLIEKLFGIKPSIYLQEKNSVFQIVVSRKKLVSFCQSIGLKIGNKVKQQVDIPDWIKQNKQLKKACIRGLFDTDGCIFYERHRIKNKTYSYKRLNFTNASLNLINSVYKILTELGFKAKIRNNRSVQIEDLEGINTYFEKIGTSNPKHKSRFGEVG